MQIDVLTSSPEMLECDIILENRAVLTERVIPNFKDFGDPHVAAAVLERVESAISDMILFLSGSPLWREPGLLKRPDPLKDVEWKSLQRRQMLVRDLKYVDVSFLLWDEFLKQTPSLTGAATFEQRMAAKKAESSGTADPTAAKKTRCMKLMVRLWVACFVSNRQSEQYFYDRGWLDTIDNLNGHGLGASDVFVSLVCNNERLVRCITFNTMLRFIGFIRSLGPLDTWLRFLAGLCAPNGNPIGMRQQDVLASIYISYT